MADMMAAVTCRECGTALGGDTGKSPYKHMLHCLHVEPDNLERIREIAEREWGERGRRVVHILDALEHPTTFSYGGGE